MFMNKTDSDEDMESDDSGTDYEDHMTDVSEHSDVEGANPIDILETSGRVAGIASIPAAPSTSRGQGRGRGHLASYGLFRDQRSDSKRRSGPRHGRSHCQPECTTSNWCGRGSGFVLEQITRLVISITKYRPLQGSGPNCNGRYIPMSKFIESKKCMINVQNSDELCFAWSVLAVLYPSKIDQNKVYRYSKYTDVLNLNGLQFPLQLKDISKFEWQNPNIAVNVLYWDEESRSFTVEYLSPKHGREKRVNLMLIEDDMSHKRHYICITNTCHLVV